ncbi:hypothetical protein ACWGND_31830 [Streptomyces althioticus]
MPLEVFTEAETRSLLTSRGVTDPDVVEAVLRLSMGLPLLVELLALARPHTVEEVDAGGDLADVAVERFVQWITDPEQREAVRACALPLQLNEDVFAAAAGPGAEGLWEWLCGQPFVSGRGGCAEQWSRLLASPVSPPNEAATRFLGLLRVLLLEPESGVAEATEEFLSANPDHETITDARPTWQS